MNHDEAEAAYDYHCYQVNSNACAPDDDPQPEEPTEAAIFKPIPNAPHLSPPTLSNRPRASPTGPSKATVRQLQPHTTNNDPTAHRSTPSAIPTRTQSYPGDR
jgi:hypothetical protein